MSEADYLDDGADYVPDECYGDCDNCDCVDCEENPNHPANRKKRISKQRRI